MHVSNRICPFCGKGDVWYLEPSERTSNGDMFCRICFRCFNKDGEYKQNKQTDIVAVVRCKDCVKREYDNCPFNEFSEFYKPDDDFYCAEGRLKWDESH